MTTHAIAERPPRLVLRFAILTALCLGAGAAAILLFTRHLHTVQAERSAAHQAELLAETILVDELQAADFRRPVEAGRRTELDRLFRKGALQHGTVLITLSRADRVVTYSTDHTLIGRRAVDGERTKEVLGGTLTSDVTSIQEPRTGSSLKVLRSYVPLTKGGRPGVVGIYQDYSPIESAAQAAFLPVAGILELVLLLLYVTLVPILARVSRRMQRHVEKIQHQAFHDDLTELPNRLHFRESIAAAIAASGPSDAAAVLLLDLDRFKEINDTLGHQCGDELLKELAVRLREVTGEDALLARLGGDEFGIVAPGHDVDAALRLAESVRSSLDAPFVAQGVPLVIEGSVGISVYPLHGADVDTLIQHADVAMYAAKDKRLGIAVYEDSLDTSTAADLALMSELRAALEREEIILHYQPQIDVGSGRVVGMEALVRWEHPERGLVPPNSFIPLVERTGLSTSLTEYVLRRVARQLQQWRDAGVEIDVTVAVNLTMFDLLDTSLPGKVARLLGEAGVEPDRLELEITERVIMADPVRVRGVVEQLKQTGVRIAIDDFGTGYSSLSYLKSLPVDVLKIDRSFVMSMMEEPSDRAIVRSTIDLAHNLGLAVVAEGVDSKDTLDELARYGCDVAQGFYISRPQAADGIHINAAETADSGEQAVAVNS